MNETVSEILEAPVAGLRGLLAQAADDNFTAWSERDLAAVFRHQWSAPLALDLTGVRDTTAERVATLTRARGLVLQSFGDLLCHENPPVALLELCKEFAKRSLYSPTASIPQDVARVLYFASIGAALSRCGRRISSLSDDDLAAGLRWGLSCDWLPKDARNVLTSGLAAIDAPSTEGASFRMKERDGSVNDETD